MSAGSASTAPTKTGVAALLGLFAPLNAVMVALLPLVGAMLFAPLYQLALWTGRVTFLPEFTWVESFLLGSVIMAALGFVFKGSILVSPWLTMVLLGVLHNAAFSAVPALGFLELLVLYVILLPLRMLTDSATSQRE